MFVSKDYELNFDIRSVMDSVGIRYSENRTHFILNECPNCGGKSKLYLDKREKFWVCFKCVKTNDMTVKEGRGNLQTFLKLIGLSYEEIKTLMKDGQVKTYTDPDMFMSLKVDTIIDDGPTEVDVPSHFEPLTCDEQNVRTNIEAYQYLANRRVVDPHVIKKFNLMYSKPMKRVVFPVHQEVGKIVGWQARDITDRWKQDQMKCNNRECMLMSKWYFHDEVGVPERCPACGSVLEALHYPKSRNSRDLPKTDLLFNQHNVDWRMPVAIVEGPFDCINTMNSVALLGKVLSPKQLAIMLDKNPPMVLLYLDGDSAGRSSTKHLINQLSPFFVNLRVVPLEDGMDPGSFTRDENTNQMINNSVSINEWVLSVDDDRL